MINDNALLAVSEKEKFVKEYKSVYQAMTAKHDCKSKIFPRNVVINISDIIELNDRICEKLVNYQEAGFTVSVSVSLRGKDSYEFSCWQEFADHKWVESNDIVSITVIWEFNAVLPQYDLPQKHVLVVKMADGLRPEEMLNIVFAGKLENIEDIDKQMYPVVARVDFINTTLGDELLQIVTEWNNGLNKARNIFPKVVELAIKHKSKIAFLIDYITRIVIILSMTRILIDRITKLDSETIAMINTNDITSLIRLCGFLYIAWMILSKFAKYLAKTFYGLLNGVGGYHVFDITRGDQNFQKELEAERSKNYIRVAITIVGTIILNIVCNLVSSMLIKF